MTCHATTQLQQGPVTSSLLLSEVEILHGPLTEGVDVQDAPGIFRIAKPAFTAFPRSLRMLRTAASKCAQRALEALCPNWMFLVCGQLGSVMRSCHSRLVQCRDVFGQAGGEASAKPTLSSQDANVFHLPEEPHSQYVQQTGARVVVGASSRSSLSSLSCCQGPA